MARKVLAGPSTPVHVDNYDETPASGPLTDTQLRATAIPVSDATTPWSCTGFKTADTVVKAAAGVFAGILVTATDAGGDIDVIVYDSPTSDLTGDIAVARVTIPTTVANTQGSVGDLSGPGIVMSKGIWVDVVAGDCQFLVYYK